MGFISLFQRMEKSARKKALIINKKRNNDLFTMMDILLIAEHMMDKTINDIDIVYGENTMTIFLNDGSSVEMIVDSIHLNPTEYDA